MKFTLSYLSDRKITETERQERSEEIEVERGFHKVVLLDQTI